MRNNQAERLPRSHTPARKARSHRPALTNLTEARTGQSTQRFTAAFEFVGDLEFASQQIPHILAVSGWLVHNSQRPIVWGLLREGSYQDISDRVRIYLRSDLDSREGLSNFARVGFIAFLEINDTSNDIQLAIGPVDSPTLVCFNVAESKNNNLETYFPGSHQLFRFGVARCIAALSEDEAQVVAPIAHFALPAWVNEIQFLDGAFHQGVSAGIDHRICTANGNCFVEGWIKPENGRKFTLDACLVGTRSSTDLLHRLAFRRPDISKCEQFPGFGFVGRGQIPPGVNPLLLLQSHLIETGEVAYAKINLDQVDEQTFARTFWSRTLDIHTINRQAMKRLLTFAGQTPLFRHERAPNNRLLNKEADRQIGAIILQNYRETTLRNLFVLTSRPGEFNFLEIVLLSPDPATGDLWWPDAGEIRILKPVRTLSEALDKINTPLVLIVDATVMATGKFQNDVRAAANVLEMKPDLNGVIVSGKDLLNGHRARDFRSIPVNLPGVETSTWLLLNKGTTNPPVVLRVSALQNFCQQVWPQLSPDLTVRTYLTATSNIQWLKSENIEVFFARPSDSFLPIEQMDLLYQIGPQL